MCSRGGPSSSAVIVPACLPRAVPWCSRLTTSGRFAPRNGLPHTRTHRHCAGAPSTQASNSTRVIEANSKDPLQGLSSPVYSLATNGSTAPGAHATMNLITYCAPMSIEPRYVALGLFKGTLSLENFTSHGTGVLQVRRETLGPPLATLAAAAAARAAGPPCERACVVRLEDTAGHRAPRQQSPQCADTRSALQVLTSHQRHLLYLLGKVSGHSVDKLGEPLVQRNGTCTFDGHTVLDHCHGYLTIERVSGPVDAGDHEVFVCKVARGACVAVPHEDEKGQEEAPDVLYADDASLRPQALQELGLEQAYEPLDPDEGD